MFMNRYLNKWKKKIKKEKKTTTTFWKMEKVGAGDLALARDFPKRLTNR